MPEASDPLSERWEPWHTDVMRRLHRWSISNRAVELRLARWLGLPTSDASALSHIVWAAEAGEPLSPLTLSLRMGMTSGATTLLVDRLAAAELVTRSRESSDRRRVTLRPTAAAREHIRVFLLSAGQEVARVLRDTEASDLETVSSVLGALTHANEAASRRLSDPAVASAPPARAADRPSST